MQSSNAAAGKAEFRRLALASVEKYYHYLLNDDASVGWAARYGFPTLVVLPDGNSVRELGDDPGGSAACLGNMISHQHLQPDDYYAVSCLRRVRSGSTAQVAICRTGTVLALYEAPIHTTTSGILKRKRRVVGTLNRTPTIEAVEHITFTVDRAWHPRGISLP